MIEIEEEPKENRRKSEGKPNESMICYGLVLVLDREAHPDIEFVSLCEVNTTKFIIGSRSLGHTCACGTLERSGN
ncbi:hypothetical protein OAA06_00070 [bacterium]|nr:hypothetical protein [bacterium]